MKNFTESPTAFFAFVCLLLCLVICNNKTLSQSREEIKKNEFGVFFGGSPDSSTIFGIGRTKDAQLGLIGFRYARRFETSSKFNLKYTIDAVPLLRLSFRDNQLISPVANSFPAIQSRRSSSARAYGISPVGLQINFRPRKKLQPFISSSGGVLYFNRRIPVFSGTQFNFMADAGVGLEIQFKRKNAVSVGYKYLHISNGNRGFENPGFDHNVFFVGYSFLR